MESFYFGMPNFLSSETRAEFAKIQAKHQINYEQKAALARWTRQNVHAIISAGWGFDRSQKARFLLEKACRDHFDAEIYLHERPRVYASLSRSKSGKWTELSLAAYITTPKSAPKPRKFLLIARAHLGAENRPTAPYWQLYHIDDSYALFDFLGKSCVPTTTEERDWTEKSGISL